MGEGNEKSGAKGLEIPVASVLFQMKRLNIPPLFCEVLRNQATMAMVRFFFAAQETPTVQQFRGNRSLDSSLPH